MAKSKLLETVLAAEQSDLEAIDKTIEDIEAEIVEKTKTIDGLKAIRKAVDVRLNGKPARKKREPKEPKTNGKPKVTVTAKPEMGGRDNEGFGTELAKKVFDLVSKEGSMPVPAIAARLGRTALAVGECVQECNWFERRGNEVHIAK